MYVSQLCTSKENNLLNIVLTCFLLKMETYYGQQRPIRVFVYVLLSVETMTTDL